MSMRDKIEQVAVKENLFPELECIYRDLLINELTNLGWDDTSVVDIVKEFPSADVAPVRHGRWKRIGENHEKCTHCGYIFEALPSQYFFEMNNKFCRMCGAKMDLED